jgi:hypothetical protein
MLRLILVTILFVCLELNAVACRFTVREIGFSTLSQDTYSLVIIDENANASESKWKEFHNQLAVANIKLVILHPEKDGEHPFVKKAISKKHKFPVSLLIGPNERMLRLNSDPIADMMDEVLDSSIRHRLRSEFSDTFCVIIWIEGKDISLNNEIENIIEKECEQIENIMPHMPKEVKIGPVSIRIDNERMQKEKVLLWSLGIDEPPDEPRAVVLYGRGRMIGEMVQTSSMRTGMLYKYMSMIGADCECGLDRKWMLGSQIPLLWSAENRQQLANEIGFDVDNPMILAEMSRILAKEVNGNISDEVGYGIEVIDLNEAFDHVPEMSYENQESDESLNVMIISLGFIIVIILGTGTYFYFRNRNS